MGNELETTASDVSAESSPAPEPTSSEPSLDNNKELSSSPESKPKQEQYVPYERFKEINEKARKFEGQFEEQQRLLKDLQDRFEKQNKPAEPNRVDPKKVLERLKGIDPEFASYQEYLQTELSNARAFQEQLQQQTYIDNAKSLVGKLQSELKVNPVLHSAYLAQIPGNTPLAKIEEAYKSLHQSMNKYWEDEKRAAISEYTKVKKADANLPLSQKGQAPKALNKTEYSKDPEEARAQLKSRMAEHMRANRNSG